MLGNVCSMVICLSLNPFNADICFKMKITAFSIEISAFLKHILLFAHMYLFLTTGISILNRYVFLNIKDICSLNRDICIKIQVQIYIYILKIKISVFCDK